MQYPPSAIFSLLGLDQTKEVYNEDDQGSVYQNIVNLMSPGAGIFVLGYLRLDKMKGVKIMFNFDDMYQFTAHDCYFIKEL